MYQSDQPAAVAGASKGFQPVSDEDWQGFRIVLFFFLLELEKAQNA